MAGDSFCYWNISKETEGERTAVCFARRLLPVFEKKRNRIDEENEHDFKIMLIIEESKKKDTYRRNTVYNKTVQPSERWLHSFIVRGFYSLSLGLNLKSTLVVVVEE
ncbi:hypothetical protein [Anaeromassilibacillus sp. SJQ-1]|uniref:hypothetical protein n=1 Tax=Anaeromassilibacillus sp. SJQ-1 TaxID=3375419 RepID=UPI00398A157E